VRGRRIKLRFAHQGGRRPPVIVIHGNQTRHVPEAYRRYLINFFRQRLKIVGSPVRLDFKTGENPYAAKGRRGGGLASRRPSSRSRRLKGA